MSDDIIKNVLVRREESVLIAENVQVGCCRRQITKKTFNLLTWSNVESGMTFSLISFSPFLPLTTHQSLL